jgi:hypothetical protein
MSDIVDDILDSAERLADILQDAQEEEMQIERLDVSAICGGPTAVLAAIRNETAMQRGQFDARSLMTIGANIVKEKINKYVYDIIFPRIETVYTIYTMMNGPYPEKWEKSDRAFQRAQADEWSSGLDDQIEKLFDEYNGVVSADFIGEVCAGNRLWEPDAITTLAAAFTKDAVRIATWHAGKDHGGPKTNAQIMSAVGIVESDLRDMAATRIEPTEKEVEQYHMNSLADAVSRIHMTTSMLGIVGAALKAQVDNASDDDDGLATGFVNLIGGDLGDIPALRDARKRIGLDGLCAMIENGNSAELAAVSYGIATLPPLPGLPTPPAAALPPIPAAPVAPAPLFDLSAFGLAPAQATDANTALPVAETLPQAPPEKAPRKKTKAADDPQAMPARLLVIARDNTGLNSQELGLLFGCARQSYENYAKGKGALIPTAEQRAQFRGVLDKHMENLKEALTLLDAVDAASGA